MTAAPSSADVVVVGGGAAGLAAAVSAATAGARVLLLEKEPRLGGTTRYAVGSFTAAGTEAQRRAGVTDDAVAFVEDMYAFAGGPDNDDLRLMLATESGPAIAWLEGLGVTFAGPFEEPPNRVPRMHNALPGARAYLDRLLRAARRRGVAIRTGVTVTGLLRDPRGRVTGVRCGAATVTARRGVVLAAGDFAGDREMRRRHLPAAAHDALPVNPASSGASQRLAAEAGAELVNMDLAYGPQLRFPPGRKGFVEKLPTWPWLTRLMRSYVSHAPAWALRPFVTGVLVAHLGPGPGLFEAGAILVNEKGARVDGAAAGLAAEHGARGYVVLTRALADRFTRPPHHVSTAASVGYAYFGDYRRSRPELVHEGRDGAALATAIGAVPANVAALGLSGPLVALGPVQAMLTVTEGGAAVDTYCRVLGPEGVPIPGLYAAGGAGQGGMRLSGHGLHIAWALVSGRRAGESAARP
ncbi:FAD-dependent oxidoreductase [Phytohabitans kaempferiae]|uniref:FAD-dependent oxidoreductase n=1 Tax=Phytohabitans kaempferiae TaxID=1620943 RepID=A0ABV6MH27_9ACTN